MGNRGFDFDGFQRQVARRFIAHQHCNFLGGFSEFLDTCLFVAHQAQLVEDQRVIHFMYCHDLSLLFLLSGEGVLHIAYPVSCGNYRFVRGRQAPPLP